MSCPGKCSEAFAFVFAVAFACFLPKERTPTETVTTPPPQQKTQPSLVPDPSLPDFLSMRPRQILDTYASLSCSDRAKALDLIRFVAGRVIFTVKTVQQINLLCRMATFGLWTGDRVYIARGLSHEQEQAIWKAYVSSRVQSFILTPKPPHSKPRDLSLQSSLVNSANVSSPSNSSRSRSSFSFQHAPLPSSASTPRFRSPATSVNSTGSSHQSPASPLPSYAGSESLSLAAPPPSLPLVSAASTGSDCRPSDLQNRCKGNTRSNVLNTPNTRNSHPRNLHALQVAGYVVLIVMLVVVYSGK